MTKVTKNNKSQENPFNPSFGEMPHSFLGREDIIENIRVAFENNLNDPYRTVLFSGMRGIGKTIILEKIAEISLEFGFVSVNITAGNSMVNDLFDQLFERTQHILSKKRKIKSFSIKQFSIEFFNDDETLGFRTRLERVLSKLNDLDIGLLITIDEIYKTAPGLPDIIIAYQHYKRERRKIALMLAGLPKNVSDILSDSEETKNFTFLRRAERVILKNIDIAEIEQLYFSFFNESGKKLSSEDAQFMAEATKGYPFMIQLVGFYVWRTSHHIVSTIDINEGIAKAKERLGVLVFAASLNDISEKDLSFLKAMAAFELPVATSDIQAKMGVSHGYVQQYRLRLLETEMIYSPSYGKLDFSIPYLKEYLL
ncbi:ATPase AAA [Bacteroidia bacterium]|nr:ATPase AAA [Bacteroidia bacterium]